MYVDRTLNGKAPFEQTKKMCEFIVPLLIYTKRFNIF